MLRIRQITRILTNITVVNKFALTLPLRKITFYALVQRFFLINWRNSCFISEMLRSEHDYKYHGKIKRLTSYK